MFSQLLPSLMTLLLSILKQKECKKKYLITEKSVLYLNHQQGEWYPLQLHNMNYGSNMLLSYFSSFWYLWILIS